MKITFELKWERTTHNYHVYTYNAGGAKPFSVYLPKLQFETMTSPPKTLKMEVTE